jgi:biotin-(acetyl-CoA carboxylase) ligase
MLFVDKPEIIQDLLPDFLTRSLRPAVLDRGSGSEALCRDLFPAGGSILTGAGPASCDPESFWSSWFLVSDAKESQYDTLRRVTNDRRETTGHVVCLAVSGRKFHGQQARGWQTASGNLHLSLALTCDLSAAECGLALTMLPAVAVLDALKDLPFGGGPVPGLGIKWVNDILAGGRKLGGVLTSARSQDGRITSFVLGLGLNVAVAPEVSPTPFTPAVTCLADHLRLPATGLKIVLTCLLQSVAMRFEELVAAGPIPLLEAYRSSSLVLGRRVEIRPDGHPATPIRRGRVLEIGPDLSLTLDDGLEPVTAGRLVLGSLQPE